MLDTICSYLPSWIQNLSSHIDFEGQRKAERVFQIILIVHGILGFIAGYVTQQLSVTMYTVGVGFILSCLAVLPPWPFYRRNPLNWQPNPVRDGRNDDKKGGGGGSTSTSSGGKNSKKTR